MTHVQTAFVIDQRDNVATALEALTPGVVRLTGEPVQPETTVTQEIPDGHKLASSTAWSSAARPCPSRQAAGCTCTACAVWWTSARPIWMW